MGYYIQQEVGGPEFEVRSKDGDNFLVTKLPSLAAAKKYVEQLENRPFKVFMPVSLLLAVHHAINCGANYETFLPEWVVNTIDGFEDALKEAGIPFQPVNHKIPAPQPPE